MARVLSLVRFMVEQPVLSTARVLLRPFRLEDAPEVQRLACDREIAATTLRIPHPYPDGAAAEWIAGLASRYEKGESVAFAITRASDGVMLGAIGLDITREHDRAELGYWIGRPYWGNGYCTEAARAVVAYAFDGIGLNRITAAHFAHNVASGRVMQNVGMTYEGHRIQEIKKWGKFEDLILYGLVRANRIGINE
ncbi:MAG TPA: GNAT family N-acetyltransferase [Gemmataceae bacterium]|jgi:RimJ/RimL family protein N-acetyltransferase